MVASAPTGGLKPTDIVIADGTHDGGGRTVNPPYGKHTGHERNNIMTVKKTAAAAQDEQIRIDRIPAARMLVPIVGTSPLIVHAFGQKARMQMLEAQQGKKRVKQIRDPEAEYRNSLYLLKPGEDGRERYGFPVSAFKAAVVGSARFYDDKRLSMTALKSMLFITGEPGLNDPQQMVEIHGEPRMREDVVRLSGISRTADLRYRGEFPEWSATLDVTYISSAISQQSVLSLIDAAGFGVGVGEWRPQKNGSYGCFRIDEDRDVKIIEA